MRGPAGAIVWEFQRRHRLGLAALGIYLVVYVIVTRVMLEDHAIRLNPPNGMAGFIIGPIAFTFFYFVGVFSYGLAGDLGARQSIFPARMFTLPMSTRALAGSPMLYGTAASVTLWILTATFVRWPGGVDMYVPWVWPALLMAAYLAWTQALMWMPYGLPGVRVAIAALWLALLDVIVLVTLNYKTGELVMSAVIAPQIPVAYLVGWYAVARARRGDLPDWSGILAPFSALANVVGRARDRFRSASGAQTWFEWRRHGRVLPAMVAIVVPVELLLLFIPGNQTRPVMLVTLFIVSITPPFFAIFAAAMIGTATPFTMTRPVTTATLVAAKLHAAWWSALLAWLAVIVIVPVGLFLSSTTTVFVDWIRAVVGVTGAARALALATFVFASLLASTWKQLVQTMCIGLTGRDWVIKSTVVLALSFLAAIGPIFDWIRWNTAVQSAIWNGLPGILVALVCLKALAASWVAVRLYDSRLLGDGVLAAGAVSWLIAVAALYGVLVWFAASPLIPRYFLAAIAILQVPLTRVSAASLALAWSRHR